MLEDHSQENTINSSFFSCPPQYPLEINSVYRPKFSNLIPDKPFNKPFYAREERQPLEKLGSTPTGEESALKTAGYKSKINKPDFHLENDVNPLSTTLNDAVKGTDDECKNPETIIKSANSDTVTQPSTPKTIIEPVEKESVPLNEAEKCPEISYDKPAIVTETDNQNTADVPIHNESSPVQVSEASKQNVTNVAPSLMELPTSVYLPPFHPVPSVMLSHSITGFQPTPIESLLNPMLAPQVFSQGQQQLQQQRKLFPKSKSKNLNNLVPMFQESGLYGMAVPPNGTNKEYYVMVHVEAGATFSIRIGDQEQQIPG